MRGWWLVVLVVAAVALGYAVMPNIWTRVFKRTALRRVPAAGRRVALTFDDGPDPKYTPRLLDVLAQCGVRATFFVIAEKAMRHAEIVERMIREGHEVAVHGMRHVLVPVLPPRSAWEQVFTAAEKLRERFGLSIRWYRPTWGLCNLPALWWTRGGRRGLRMVTWSIMVGDWRRTAPGVLRSRILRRLHPGAILVLHDSDETWGSEAGAPERVIELMPELTEALAARGYRLGPLRDLLAAGVAAQPGTGDSSGAASVPLRPQ
ncbi:polysaccharide deacetylase family protein [Alicyclobacillus macrosporangiidus]|jgi:peptidoglycan/xylan/chitin deacetylase (PgdA/CDA1 family)|uniref:Peptidoglycan/xylan/chitin deacetylase, PgdA/CDA1 family n=1 Tax=Alicyclobacillus macrosporangiidus TaxID=392015 RepID=A0A1I7JP16_9BACL|nr:polysaccharide deacetylase family protein [Alicyclobacillus macrosporangiidus]SFU86925.1 Peptidoglycan/xylan/chitin deacetylase, PgdA/CDA1 family [Alicyclobacillus macrosporangiidus]